MQSIGEILKLLQRYRVRKGVVAVSGKVEAPNTWPESNQISVKSKQNFKF